MQSTDVIVVGGGIHGVGVAQAAAAAGHGVLLLEKTALAAGTSSRSSKLIHGGLRYLETAQFRLVRESLRERATLLRIAPELVALKPFYIPVYRGMRRNAWQLRAGLALYAGLGGLGADCRFREIPRRLWGQLGGLRSADLQTVFCYSDAQTDDALLTRAVMNSACALGAVLHLPAEFVNAEVREDQVIVRYSMAGRDMEYESKVLVNAGGPWASRIASRMTPARSTPALELIRGTHILLADRARDGIFYLENPRDGRAVFVMPRGSQTLVGTTEARFDGDPDQVQPLPAEVDYLLAVLRHYFQCDANAEAVEVLDAWAGLRVLPAGRSATFARSRETIFDLNDPQCPRVISIYGGKLTTYRATAERVLSKLAPSLPTRRRRARTEELRLTPA